MGSEHPGHFDSASTSGCSPFYFCSQDKTHASQGSTGSPPFHFFLSSESSQSSECHPALDSSSSSSALLDHRALSTASYSKLLSKPPSSDTSQCHSDNWNTGVPKHALVCLTEVFTDMTFPKVLSPHLRIQQTEVNEKVKSLTLRGKQNGKITTFGLI